MADRKTATLMLRLSPAIKQDLRARATRERRSLSNMVEVMILDYIALLFDVWNHRFEPPLRCAPPRLIQGGEIPQPAWERYIAGGMRGAVDYRNDEVPCACGPHACATVSGVR